MAIPAIVPILLTAVSIGNSIYQAESNKKLGKGYTGGAVASGVAGKIIENTLYYLEEK